VTYLICFEGIDGSGKTSQLNLLFHHLSSLGHKVEKRSYPVYTSFFGKEIGRFLAAKDTEEIASSVDSKSMALWYALDRWLDYQTNLSLFSECEYLLLNRYTLSSIVYQSLRSNNFGEVQSWVETLEHSILELPRPHAYIIFDVVPEIAQRNIMKKGTRVYIDNDADVYEQDFSLQLRAQRLYLEIAKRIPNTKIIRCHHQGEMLNQEAIFGEVLKALERLTS